MPSPRGPRERAEAALAATLLRLPAPVIRRIAGKPLQIDGQRLHPQVQLALRLAERSGGSTLLPVAQARERRRRDARIFSGPRIDVARVEELELPGPEGPLAARLYAPEPAVVPPPLLVYFHGGGHVLGDLETHDQPCRFLARELPALVLSVEYRLAPEHRFPAAVEDAAAAFRWAHDAAERLGADPERVAVAGDSAGGNLAAVVCQLAVAEGGPVPDFQALIYPVIDFSSRRRSYELFGKGFFLTDEEMGWFTDHYLPSAAERDDPRASPILAEDLSPLPPAHVVTAGFDPLRDEGEAYVERLREAGVRVTHRREADLVHGFINPVALGGRAREAMDAIVAALREGLASSSRDQRSTTHGHRDPLR